MTMSVRHVTLTNATGAVVAAGGASTQIGQDYSGIVIKRTLAAIDVGATAGKTQDAAGMIFAEVQAGAVKTVVSIAVYRAGVLFLGGAGPILAKPGFTITDANGVSTIRLTDTSGTTGLLAAGDVVVMFIAVGNS